MKFKRSCFISPQTKPIVRQLYSINPQHPLLQTNDKLLTVLRLTCFSVSQNAFIFAFLLGCLNYYSPQGGQGSWLIWAEFLQCKPPYLWRSSFLFVNCFTGNWQKEVNFGATAVRLILSELIFCSRCLAQVITCLIQIAPGSSKSKNDNERN